MPLFADLGPPPHGLVTLRARMLRRRKRAAAFAGLVLGPAAAGAAIVAFVMGATEPPPFDHPALVRASDVHGVEVVVESAGTVTRVPAIPVADGVYLIP